jgi:hypothetical protein
MRELIILAIGLAAASAATAQRSNNVRGHVRSDGTYVQSHQRTNPNSTTLDNYSTRPNVNPYTGRVGTVDPYKAPSTYQPYKPKY